MVLGAVKSQRRSPHRWARQQLLSMVGILGACSVALVGCGGGAEPGQEDDSQSVVVTTTILADLTEEVAGDEVDVTGILQPGDDPHVYEPVPQDTATLEEATLIFYNGYNLEPALVRLIEGSGVEATQVAIAEAVPPLEMDYDGQPVPDPHVWGDVKNAIAMVEAIRDALSEQFPEDAAAFEANAAELIATLEQLETWVQAQIATIPEDQRKLVTTHDAFQYYSQAYGVPVLGT
ncbi:MAG: zinc ABC transporter substrate-binding protein, partial [Cyanobacteria bacterium P01_H01_bin.130]